jgi:predicted RNA binding protein YcfA (HicA-like mRNA interferase family)
MSEIEWSRLRSLTARELIAALIRDGFSLRQRAGSHRRYRHPDGRRVTVSFHHPGGTFRPKTLRSMIHDQARWSGNDLRRLKILNRLAARALQKYGSRHRLDVSASRPPVHSAAGDASQTRRRADRDPCQGQLTEALEHIPIIC